MKNVLIQIGIAGIIVLISASAPVKRAGYGALYQEAVNIVQKRTEVTGREGAYAGIEKDTCIHWDTFTACMQELSKNYTSKTQLFIAMVEHFDRAPIDMPTNDNTNNLLSPGWSIALLLILGLSGYFLLSPFSSESIGNGHQKVTNGHSLH